MLKLIYWIVLITMARGIQAHHPAHSPVHPNPIIDRVYPDHGKAGDKVTIAGRGFGMNPADIQVTIGGVPVETTRMTVADPGYQTLVVQLSERTISGLVSVKAGDQRATYRGTFCAEPVIEALTPIPAGDSTIVVIRGTNFDPSAVVRLGGRPHTPQRCKTGRRPHRIDATQLLILARAGTHGAMRVENKCPNGHTYADTSALNLLNLIKY